MMTFPITSGTPEMRSIEHILERVMRYTGLALRESDLAHVCRLVEEHAIELGFADIGSYERSLTQSEGPGLEALAQRLTIKETSFFRHPQQFDVLREHILPEILALRGPTHTLNLWSAGCSIGAEAYSLAITVQQVLGPLLHFWHVHIWATDLDENALAVAREGLYTASQMRGLNDALRQRYFTSEGDRFRLDEGIREMVTFAPFNLNAPHAWEGLPRMDMILCRNVIIYFDRETNRALMQRFRQVLADDGYLFLGHSETLWEISPCFVPLRTQSVFVYRPALPAAPPPKRPTSSHPPAQHMPRVQPSRPTPSGGAQERSGRQTTGAVPSTPRGQVAALDQARALLEGGQNKAALGLLRPYLSDECAEAHLLAARALANDGAIHEAAQECESAARIDPLLGDAYYLGGILALAHDHLAGAALAFERLIYLRPTDPLGHYYLALTYEKRQRRGQALRSFRNTVRLMAGHAADEPIGEISIGLLRLACQNALERLDT